MAGKSGERGGAQCRGWETKLAFQVPSLERGGWEGEGRRAEGGETSCREWAAMGRAQRADPASHDGP